MSVNDNIPKSQEEQWRDLMQKVQGGDKAAYTKLLYELTGYIRNFVRPRLANPEWADDVVQEVLISIHKSLHTYTSDRPFKPWMISIINFRVTDFLRKHYASRSDMKLSLDENILHDHVTNSDHAGEYRDVEKALDGLPEIQQRVFKLLKIKGYSAKEVADMTGMSVSAVKVSAHRTLNKLKEIGNE